MSFNIHVKPDALKASQLLAEEQRRDDEWLSSQSIVMDEFKMGNLTGWAQPGHEKDRSLTPREKIALDVMEGFLAIKAVDREEKCWMHSLGCTRNAHVWVYEIGFDRKEEKAALDFAQVSTANKTGSTPGFCMFHMAESPAMLAERVYFSEMLMQWGYLPTRWFCKFTDGTSVRGPIKQINPNLVQPDIIEEFIPTNRQGVEI